MFSVVTWEPRTVGTPVPTMFVHCRGININLQLEAMQRWFSQQIISQSKKGPLKQSLFTLVETTGIETGKATHGVARCLPAGCNAGSRNRLSHKAKRDR